MQSSQLQVEGGTSYFSRVSGGERRFIPSLRLSLLVHRTLLADIKAQVLQTALSQTLQKLISRQRITSTVATLLLSWRKPRSQLELYLSHVGILLPSNSSEIWLLGFSGQLSWKLFFCDKIQYLFQGSHTSLPDFFHYRECKHPKMKPILRLSFFCIFSYSAPQIYLKK